MGGGASSQKKEAAFSKKDVSALEKDFLVKPSLLVKLTPSHIRR
jgi:hypothetical protein